MSWNCIEFYWIVFNCIVLHSIALNCMELYAIASNWIESNWIELNWIELNWIEVNWIAWHCIALHCIALHCIDTVHQGEGGERGDPLMPLLFSVRQHAALEAIHRRLFPTEKLPAFLDDTYVVKTRTSGRCCGNCGPSSIVESCADPRVHGGKTHVWNGAGTKPEACDVLQQKAKALDPDSRVRVWRGSEVPTTEQRIIVLGTPLAHEDFVREHLERTREKHRVLLRRIPIVPDVQSAWLLLLHCASTRANYLLRVVRPEYRLTIKKCGNAFAAFWRCLLERNQSHERPPRFQWHLEVVGWGALKEAGGLLFSQVGPTLSQWSKRDTRKWQSSHSCERGGTSPCLGSARRAAVVLDGVDGFHVPSWSAVASGLPPRVIGDAADKPVERTQLRSQSGPCAGVPFNTYPNSPLTRLDLALFRVHLQRRYLTLPVSLRICGCGQPLDLFFLTITAQHVRGQGLWRGAGFHWEVPSPRSQNRHQHVGEIWTWDFLWQATIGVWRWLWASSHCTEMWTQRWCQMPDEKRRLHTNTAYARLTGLHGPVKGRKAGFQVSRV